MSDISGTDSKTSAFEFWAELNRETGQVLTTDVDMKAGRPPGHRHEGTEWVRFREVTPSHEFLSNFSGREFWIRDQYKSFGITSGAKFVAFEQVDREGIEGELIKVREVHDHAVETVFNRESPSSSFATEIEEWRTLGQSILDNLNADPEKKTYDFMNWYGLEQSILRLLRDGSEETARLTLTSEGGSATEWTRLKKSPFTMSQALEYEERIQQLETLLGEAARAIEYADGKAMTDWLLKVKREAKGRGE